MNFLQWKTNLGSLIMSSLPGLDLSSAMELAETWTAANGGWTPNDIGDPEGEGSFGGEGGAESATVAITATEMAKAKTLHLVVPVHITLSVGGPYDTDVFNDILGDLENEIAAEFGKIAAGVPGLDGGEASWGDAGGTVVKNSDIQNASSRQSIAASAAENDKSEPLSAATIAARESYGLDQTWVASEFYYPSETSPVYVTVRKYTSGAYSSLDQTATHKYIVSLTKTLANVLSITKTPL